jgi:hypothetical protein
VAAAGRHCPDHAANSPQIVFRVPQNVRDRAAEIVEREGKTISQLAREALEARVKASWSTPTACPSTVARGLSASAVTRLEEVRACPVHR